MKLFNLLSACILLTSLLEIQPLAQTRSRFAKPTDSPTSQPCPDAKLRKVWIKRVGGSGFVAVSLRKVDGGFIYYCLGADEHTKPWNEVQAIHFDSQPEATNGAPPDKGPAYDEHKDSFIFRKANILPSKPKMNRTFSGTVKVLAELKADGSVGEVALVNPSNSSFDELVKLEAKKILFVPEYRNGLPVTSIEIVELTFHNGTLPPDSNIPPMPEIIGPKLAEEVPRKVTKLRWNPVPGAVSYKISVFYTEGRSTRYLPYPEIEVQAQTISYDLPHLGSKVTGIKWKVEVLFKDDRKSVSPESYFYYSK